MAYQWDPAKAHSNVKRHGVDFADAVTSLEDELSLVTEDQLSEGEERFICLGRSAEGFLLVTVFCYRGDDIRIISSRHATAHERRKYEEP
ncbi:MAG: BrnT family toxin [Pseudomonadota bacterium]